MNVLVVCADRKTVDSFCCVPAPRALPEVIGGFLRSHADEVKVARLTPQQPSARPAAESGRSRLGQVVAGLRDQIGSAAHRYDVIHALDFVAGAAALAAVPDADRRVVLRAQPAAALAGQDYSAWTAVVRAADAVVVPSTGDRQAIAQAHRGRPDGVLECADAALVAERLFAFEHPGAPPGPSADDDPVLVGFSGVPESSATGAGLVRALARHPRLRIRIAGCPPNGADDRAARRRLALRAHAQRCGVADRLEFYLDLGRDDVIKLVDGSVGVLATRETPTSGLSALVAMHRGRAVIGVNSRTVDDIVVDRVTGRLVRPDDTLGLAAAIDELLEGSYLPLAWGMGGHDRVTSRFSRDAVVKSLLQAYGVPN